MRRSPPKLGNTGQCESLRHPGALPAIGSSVRAVMWGCPRGTMHAFPSSRTRRHGQRHTVPKSEQRRHVAAVPGPSDAVFLCFPLSPSGQKVRYYGDTKTCRRGSSGLSGGSKEQECNEALWEGALSRGTAACPQGDPWQVCPTGLPSPWQSPTRKGQEAEPRSGTRRAPQLGGLSRGGRETRKPDTQGWPAGQPALCPLPA